MSGTAIQVDVLLQIFPCWWTGHVICKGLYARGRKIFRAILKLMEVVKASIKEKKSLRDIKSHECLQSAVASLPSPRHSIKKEIKIILVPVVWPSFQEKEPRWHCSPQAGIPKKWWFAFHHWGWMEAQALCKQLCILPAELKSLRSRRRSCD